MGVQAEGLRGRHSKATRYASITRTEFKNIWRGAHEPKGIPEPSEKRNLYPFEV